MTIQKIMAKKKDYFTGEAVSIMRSEIRPSDYNPRYISDEGRKALKRSIKRYGVVGGIVVNKQTGNTIVGGHQKVAILDELNKYNPVTLENDYPLRVEMIDVDEKTEKSLNVTLNNPNVGGDWDADKMRQLIPDIDWKDAGLTDADLNLFGVDFLLQTEEEAGIASELDGMMAEVNAEHQAEVERRAEERKAEREASRQAQVGSDADDGSAAPSWEDKVQHMKDVKQQVRDAAVKAAEDMDAYVMLSFTDFNAKAAFMQRFGYSPYDKIIKVQNASFSCR